MAGVGPLEADDPRRVGRYVLLGRLGAGGMGRVYLGRSPGGSLVAVKVVHAAYASDERFRERFRREVTAARAVSGAFTAPVIDADPDAASPWLVTAYLPGVSLQEAVKSHGPWPVPVAAALGAALAEALLSIHRAGIVHRDLKPSNVMLAVDGPRVIDFGIARAADAAAITRTGAVLGTPGYLAPEQALGEETGPAGDVFALGAVLVFTLTGNGPFGSGPMQQMLYRVVHEPPRLDGVTDPRLRALAAACLHKDPALRPAPTDLLRELGGGAAGVPRPPAPVAAQIERAAAARIPTRSVPRRVVLAGAGGAAAAALAAGTVWALTRPDGTVTTGDTEVATPTRPGRPGRLLWRYDASLAVRSTPAVARGLVLVGGESGRLYALDTASGRPRWQYAAGGEITTGVAVAGDVVITGCADGAVHGVDVRTGRRRWRRRVGVETFTPVVSGASVYVAARTQGDAGVIVRLAAADGALRWRHATVKPVAGALAVADGMVVVPDETLYALDAGSGSYQWRTDVDRAIGTAVWGRTVYCGTEVPTLQARDLGSGGPRWAFEPDDKIRGPVTRAGNVLYAADESGTVYALEESGRQRWRAQLSGAVLAPVTAAAGLLYVGAGDKRLYALNPTTGSIVWSYETGDAIAGSAAVVSGRSVFVGGTDGYVYAFHSGA
ncbi:Serine/threonine protein kinase [Thermomonospora echinospora]|uniref:Serine/threonine protein kinase n=1 Tax=Thermomonospora echinospora TaxID=1992 RepID=A0A1H6D8H5_9ACTN|nr:serine/threonine-protein kinase [Thermomonospora echinospora]SEG80776.1 Serine/threonine protein kinase [Thermomonospora echinospora]